MSAAATTAPDWVMREVARGLQGLLALRLPGAPGEDTIGHTLDVWLVAIAPRACTWRETDDAARIRQAFGELFRRAERWPVPRDLLDALPAPRPSLVLPAPRLTPEERAANRARLDALMQSITARFKGGSQ